MQQGHTESAQYARSLIEASLDPLVTISPEGKITDVNEASIKVTGVPRETLIGTDFAKYFTEPILAQAGYERVFEEGFVADYPLTIRHTDGHLTDVLYNASVYKDAEGVVLGVFAAARDITSQKQASQYARSLLEASLDPLVTIDANGKIMDVNEASIMVTGVLREHLIGTNFSDYFTEPTMAQAGYEQVFKKGFVADYPLTIRHKDGRLTDVMYNASVFRDTDGVVLGVFAAARDVTEQKQSSQYARSLLEASLDPLVTIDSIGKIMDVNEASVKVTGVNREQLIGTDFSDYFTDPQLAQAGYEQVFEKSFVADYPLTIRHADGHLTDVMYNASVYKNSEGLVLGVFAAARDVTEQKWAIDLRIANKELAFQNDEKENRAAELSIANKELAFQNDEKEKRAAELGIANKELAFQNQEKEKRAAELSTANEELAFQNNEKEKRAAELAIANYSRSLIEAILDPLFTISPAGKITDVNNASADFTGVSRELLIGSDFFYYFTDPEHARRAYEQVFSDGFIVDYPLTIKDHRYTDVLFNGSIYKDEAGKVVGAVVVGRDITDQKRVGTELLEAKVVAEMAAVIAEEAQAQAEIAMLKANDAVKAKQQFLSNMSHEIRTPMNAIIGFTKVVMKTDLSVRQREYLNAIKLSGDALIVLINDILDLAKVDAGKMTFEKTPFKLAASISAMLHLFETKIHEKNLVLELDYDANIPEVLEGDPVRLHQIILNLVSNAVKFTSEGKIKVSVRLVSEDDAAVKVAFAVSDTGIGIAESKIESIFENFQQATSSTSRLYGGTGLGLAIVKQLVEQQGGTITVTSQSGIGASFVFELSFMQTHAIADPLQEVMEVDAEYRNIKVLVVEDIPLNQLLMKTLLDDFGFEREIAGNGRIAIEKLQVQSYDIILMDLQMPEMNGFEATEYIRRTMNSKIPIIALTADVTTVDVAKCRAVGMNDYIAKPVDERLLYSKIVGLVRKPMGNKAGTVFSMEKEGKPGKCTDMEYLSRRTKSNPSLMMEMIDLYLQQTPPLISAMKQGLLDKDWETLHAAVHKMIPSFAIMGIGADSENLAKRVQEFAKAQEEVDAIHEMVLKLEQVCLQACEELEEEYYKLKNIKL